MKRTCGQGLWVLAALGLAAILARPAAAGMGFSEPRALNANALTDSGNDYLPEIAGDGHGVWIAVWYSFDGLGGALGTDGDILFVRSVDSGATWSNPAPLNSNAATDSGVDAAPKIATDGNGVWIVVWESDEDLGGATHGNYNVFFSRSSDGGATWSPVAILNSNFGSFVENAVPSLATDLKGNWIVTWSSFDHLDRITQPNYNVLYTRSGDNGGTWSQAATLTTGNGSDIRSSINTDRNGTWMIAWDSTDALGGTIGSDWDVLYSKSVNNGLTWTPAKALNTNAAIDSGIDGELPYGVSPTGPSLATDGTTWICAWESNDTLGGTKGVDSDILFARSIDSGTTWSFPLPLNSQALTDPQDATGNDYSPHIATDRQGTWICVWTTEYFSSPLHSDTDIAISRSTDAGITWTPISTLDSYMATDFQGQDDMPIVASDEQGTWAVVWNARDSFFTGGHLDSDLDPLVAMSNSIADPPDPPLAASTEDLLNVIIDVILGKKVLDQNGDGVVDAADVVALTHRRAQVKRKEADPGDKTSSHP